MIEYNPRDLVDLIIKPIVTEKGSLLLEQNKYVFQVQKKQPNRKLKQRSKVYLR